MKTLKEWNEDLIYKDTFSLYASYWQETQDVPVFVREGAASIVDAPCYLSKGKSTLGTGMRMDQPQKIGDHHNSEERVLVLFCDTCHTIAIGDLLKITAEGVTRDYVAGAPHRYPLYQEVLVYCKGDA